MVLESESRLVKAWFTKRGCLGTGLDWRDGRTKDFVRSGKKERNGRVGCAWIGSRWMASTTATLDAPGGGYDGRVRLS